MHFEVFNFFVKHFYISFFSSGLIRECFETTPKMSTYLVALVVSEFECRENDGKTFSVRSRSNAFEQNQYSFDLGQKMLAKFDELFNYKYNSYMPQMTIVAMTDQSLPGGMENWGKTLLKKKV